MTYADRMNSQHSVSDPADTRMRINTEVRIRIRDEILALAECAVWKFVMCRLSVFR